MHDTPRWQRDNITHAKLLFKQAGMVAFRTRVTACKKPQPVWLD
jgi:hypothetical protein